MATNDTDPQRTEPFAAADDASRTQPDAPPEQDASDVAAGLLADLARTALPTDEVAETEGHNAASYAVAPHRPPRANEKTIENPAVFVNATMPLPAPPSSGRVKLGPPAPSVVSMKGELTVPGGARLLEAQNRNETTEPGERARNQLRVLLASIGGVVVAALVAITILLLSTSRTKPQPTTSSSAPPAIGSPAAPTQTPTAAVTPTTTASTTATTTAPTTTTTTTTTSAPTGPLAKPRPKTSSSPPTPSPSGTFAAPDRTL